MPLKETLRAIWKDMTNFNGPYRPAPEVKEKLEKMGYDFRLVALSFGFVPALAYNISSPQGERIGQVFNGKAATAQYQKDYAQVVEECKPALS